MLKSELIQLRKHVRIRDVAEAAGVSTTSVSRHLSGQIVLPRATAIRIDAAVQRLEYRPNAIARRLSRQKSETLGLVTTDIAYPFFAAVASAAEAEATRYGYSMAIFNSRNEMARELVFLSKIEDQQVDGILFMTNHVDDGRLSRQIARSGRVVLVDEDVKGAPAPRVFASNETGGALAARHLIELGHRRIAYVSGPRGMISCEERYLGFRQVVAEVGASLDPRLVLFGAYEEQYGVTAFTQLWSTPNRPTAVFATSDMLAIGVMRAARAFGVEVPRDLSVVGFDDMLHVNLLTPALTTVRESATEFGRHGVKLLLEDINGEAKTRSPLRIPVDLVVRDSTAPPSPPRRRGKAVRRRAEPHPAAGP
jgi:LacI family transcriptional regulator